MGNRKATSRGFRLASRAACELIGEAHMIGWGEARGSSFTPGTYRPRRPEVQPDRGTPAMIV